MVIISKIEKEDIDKDHFHPRGTDLVTNLDHPLLLMLVQKGDRSRTCFAKSLVRIFRPQVFSINFS